VTDPIIEDKLIGTELAALISASSESELFLIVANAMATIVDAEQAVVWLRRIGGKPYVVSVSGLSSVERNIDFTHWFEAAAKLFLGDPDPPIELIPDYFDNPRLQHERSLYLLSEALHAKLVSTDGQVIGGIFISRTTPFTDADVARLMTYVSFVRSLHARWYNHSFRKKIGKILSFRKALYAAAAIAVVSICLTPVRMSAIASVEVSPKDPTPIAASQDGVIERILVRPNQEVSRGTPLVRYDDAVVKNRLAVARQNVGVAQADLDRTTGKAFGDETARAELRTLRAKVAEKSAESRYLEELTRRLEIRAAGQGIAIFAGTEEWIGRPVQSGERIMMLADPTKVWITLYLPPDEMIPMEANASVEVHLDIDPLSSLKATVVESSYEAVLTPEGHLAYQLRATLDEGQAIPRIGLKGVARIYGGYRSIGYLLFRKPLRALRRIINW
jgi:multidrug resistance efflux pump